MSNIFSTLMNIDCAPGCLNPVNQFLRGFWFDLSSYVLLTHAISSQLD